MPNKQTEIALDRLFALKNGYNIRDTIRMSGKSMTITGLISVPDYTSLIQKNSDMMMDPIHFGIAIVTDTGFRRCPMIVWFTATAIIWMIES